MFFNPKLLQGKGIIEDPETHEHLNNEKLYRLYRENENLIQTLFDIDTGIVHLTLKEYQSLSVPALTAIRIYRKVKSDYND